MKSGSGAWEAKQDSIACRKAQPIFLPCDFLQSPGLNLGTFAASSDHNPWKITFFSFLLSDLFL